MTSLEKYPIMRTTMTAKTVALGCEESQWSFSLEVVILVVKLR